MLIMMMISGIHEKTPASFTKFQAIKLMISNLWVYGRFYHPGKYQILHSDHSGVQIDALFVCVCVCVLLRKTNTDDDIYTHKPETKIADSNAWSVGAFITHCIQASQFYPLRKGTKRIEFSPFKQCVGFFVRQTVQCSSLFICVIFYRWLRPTRCLRLQRFVVIRMPLFNSLCKRVSMKCSCTAIRACVRVCLSSNTDIVVPYAGSYARTTLINLLRWKHFCANSLSLTSSFAKSILSKWHQIFS